MNTLITNVESETQKDTHKRQLSSFDSWIIKSDKVLKSLIRNTQQYSRLSPATNEKEAILSDAEKTHIAGLMRINHTGEVCAQGLYNGQALTAKLDNIEEMMKEAAAEEIDHLAWCSARLSELDSRPSPLNPIWYSLSFGLGAVAGFAGDRWSLGFVAETEKQVCKHLDRHIKQIPAKDTRSLKIIHQMRADEAEHANNAVQAGAHNLPYSIKLIMKVFSKVMTTITYRI